MGYTTHLQDGVLELVEVDRLEALEGRVPPAQVVEQWRQRLAVVVNIVNHDSHRLHEPERVTFEPRVTLQLVAVQVTEAEDGLDERVPAEDLREYSRSAPAEVRRQKVPVLDERLLVLRRQDDGLGRRQDVVAELGVLRRVLVRRPRHDRRSTAHRGDWLVTSSRPDGQHRLRV